MPGQMRRTRRRSGGRHSKPANFASRSLRGIAYSCHLSIAVERGDPAPARLFKIDHVLRFDETDPRMKAGALQHLNERWLWTDNGGFPCVGNNVLHRKETE